MKNPFKVIDEKLREKYWYSERMYQHVKSTLVGCGLSFILFIVPYIIWILKQFC